jgi:putative glutamine amidotransferase
VSHLIAISQRVDILPDRGERRDALDQQWYPFLAECGYMPVSIPNIGDRVGEWLDRIGPAGVILSGGNDLVELGGDAPERDRSELNAIDWAFAQKKPLLGVCRGMQLLAHRAGVSLKRVNGHVAVRHDLTSNEGADTTGIRTVNSFHNWALPTVSEEWNVGLIAVDGTIESMRHKSLPVAGVMWHPERERPFATADIAFFKEFFRTTQ